MYIFYISSSLLPSSEANSVHVMKMCQAFAENGQNVTLFGRDASFFEDKADIFSKYGTKPCFELSLVRAPKIKMLWNVLYTKGMLKGALAKPKPDMFYSRYPFGLFFCVKKFSNTNFILESHSLPRTFLQRFIEGKLFKHNKFKHLVVISEVLKQDYLERFPFLSAENIMVAHDGADIPKGDAVTLPALKGDSSKPKAMYCGRLTEGKGLGLISELIPLCPDVEFHIIGGSESEVKFWSEKVQAPNAHFYGHINHGALSGYYSQMDVMLAPLQEINMLSRKYDIGRWTSPLKIFEYMAEAKPIIASDIEVLREVLAHKENCLLISPENAREWKKALDQLIADKSLSSSLGQSAFEDLSSKYTWKIRAENVIAQ